MTDFDDTSQVRVSDFCRILRDRLSGNLNFMGILYQFDSRLPSGKKTPGSRKTISIASKATVFSRKNSKKNTDQKESRKNLLKKASSVVSANRVQAGSQSFVPFY